LKKIAVLLFVLSIFLLSGISSFADTLESVQYQFDKAQAKDSGGIQYSIPEEFLFGDWKVDRYLGSYSHTFTQSEMYDREKALNFISYALGSVSAGSTTLMNYAESVYRENLFDPFVIGGVYSKSYYLKKLYDPNTSGCNIPVPHEFSYWTILYDSPYMRVEDIVYIKKIGDGIRLAME